MKVLMFGWEFPPFNSGGLGTACYEITKALSEKNVEINFVLPRDYKINENFLNIISTKLPKIKIREVDSLLVSYMTSENYTRRFFDVEKNNIKHNYCNNLIEEVRRYSLIASEIAAEIEHDVIHVHDWMTFPAGIAARNVSNKPLIAHVHSTEYDRSGGHSLNPYVYQIEKNGINNANNIIAVSNLTKNKIINGFGQDDKKIDIIHNAINIKEFMSDKTFHHNFKNHKIVLFLGRLTLHKGPDYFLLAAKKVLEKNKKVLFIIAGSGDMDQQIIQQAADLDISDKVLFTGFLRGNKLKQIYKMADLYIMPSVSEPFGITSLESLASGTPAMISKQSGVSEVLNHCLKVDFWNTDEMANKILAVIDNDELQTCLSNNGQKEVQSLKWSKVADKIIKIYHKAINKQKNI